MITAGLFGPGKPVIAMVHLGVAAGHALCTTRTRGLEGIVEDARADLEALQAAGVDAVMFGNENDRPYKLEVDAGGDRDDGLCHRPAADEVTGALRGQRAVGPARDAGARRGDGRAVRARDLHRRVCLGHGHLGPGRRERARATAGWSGRATSCGSTTSRRSSRIPWTPGACRTGRARAVMSSVPDAVLVSGAITGEAAAMSDLEAVKAVLPDDAGARQHRRPARDRGGCAGGRRRAHRGLGAQGRRRHLEAGRSGPRPRLHGPGRAARGGR